MDLNDPTEGNVECEKAMTKSLLDLNDFVLLQVFSYLNLGDCNNFAGTSKRLKSVGALHFAKYKRFDLLKYERCQQPEKLPTETMLTHIGQHIENLSIYSMRSTVENAVVENCVNVTTLRIYDCKVTSRLKKWMQQLKLESLTIKYCRDFNEMSVGLATLKELKFTDDVSLSSMQITNILEKTAELETLTVSLLNYRDFNFDIFTKLPKLQCLDIWIESADLVNLTGCLRMDVLTRFKLNIPFNCTAEDLPRLNSFLEILAEKSKLHELQLRTDIVDQKTFRVLKSFHDVTSLGFYASYYVDHKRDECWMIHQLVDALPNLRHLDFLDKFLRIENVNLVINKFAKLETFKFVMQTKESDELRINEMLKTTTSRPLLTLYINSKTKDGVKIELRFNQSNHRRVRLGLDDSYFLTDDHTGRL